LHVVSFATVIDLGTDVIGSDEVAFVAFETFSAIELDAELVSVHGCSWSVVDALSADQIVSAVT
jgi:hypothetical protein